MRVFLVLLRAARLCCDPCAIRYLMLSDAKLARDCMLRVPLATRMANVHSRVKMLPDIRALLQQAAGHVFYTLWKRRKAILAQRSRASEAAAAGAA